MEAEKSPELFYNDGITHFEEGNLEAAAECFSQAIELDGSVFDYHYNLGVAYINMEKYEEAIEAFAKAIPLKSNDADLYSNLGLAYTNTWDLQKAAKAYKKAVFINSGDDQNCNFAGIACCAIKCYKEAINYFKMALKMEPRSEVYNYNIAQAYYELGGYEQAEEYLINLAKYINRMKPYISLWARFS